MLLQVTLRILLFGFVIINVQSKRYQTKFCAECEEEVWEEVPCEVIFSSTTTTTTTTPVTSSVSTATPLPSTETTTSTPTTISTSTIAPISPVYPIASTVGTPIYQIPPNLTVNQVELSPGFKKCYCECKSGCREFCRKVVLNPDASKQILQLSRTIEPQANGHIELKYLQERNFVSSPGSYQTSNLNISPYYQQQQQQHVPNLAYVESKPVYNPAQTYNALKPIKNYNPANDVNSFGITLEDFSKLLNSDQAYFNTIPKISPIDYPLLNQQPLTNPPVKSSYYSSPVSPAQRSYSKASISSAISGAKTVQLYSNGIPGASKPNYPLPNLPTIPKPSSYPQQPPYAPVSTSFVDTQTAVSGGGSASAVASSPDKYKSSLCSNPSQDYKDASPLPPSSKPLNPCAIRYKDASSALNSLQNIDPAIDTYLRGILYANPPITSGYRYPL